MPLERLILHASNSFRGNGPDRVLSSPNLEIQPDYSAPGLGSSERTFAYENMRHGIGRPAASIRETREHVHSHAVVF